MTADAATVYWALTAFPLVLLTGILVPLVPRAGVWFTSTPTRDQGLLLGMFAFSTLLGAFGIREPGFAVFMALCGTAVLFQSWGPKRWKNDRVYGAYLVPVKIRGWSRVDGKVLVRLGWGGQLQVAEVPRNRAFLEALQLLPVQGSEDDVGPPVL